MSRSFGISLDITGEDLLDHHQHLTELGIQAVVVLLNSYSGRALTGQTNGFEYQITGSLVANHTHFLRTITHRAGDPRQPLHPLGWARFAHPTSLLPGTTTS